MNPEDVWGRADSTLNGLATPIRHRSMDQQKCSSHRLQEILISSAEWNDCGNGSSSWRNLSGGIPLRPHQQQQIQQHQQRVSGNIRQSQWSESLKDIRSGCVIDGTGSTYGDSGSSGCGGPEPFIPPPPLLDFETSSLLPPLGLDVSSPSDDVHFLSIPVSSGSAVGCDAEESQPPPPPADYSIPAQYATLRRPIRISSDASRSVGSGVASEHSHHMHWLKSETDLLGEASGCHSKSDGLSMRKCTCGQKMRLSSFQDTMISHRSSGGSGMGTGVASDDGLTGIATIRRPIKRKGRNSSQSSSVSIGSSQQQQQSSHPAGKLETSVLLDKLLRAGALRPEDYLVLSRMERMIMASHNTSVGSARGNAASTKSSKSSSSLSAGSPTDSGVDMRREFDYPQSTSVNSGVSGIVKSGGSPPESLYDVNPLRRSSATGLSDHGSHTQQHLPQRMHPQQRGSSKEFLDHPPPPTPDYYSMSYPHSGRSSDLHHHSVHSQHAQPPPHSLVSHPPYSSERNGSSGGVGSGGGVDNGSISSYSGSAGLYSTNRCPCCGSPSHPGVNLHSACCTLCGGGPHSHHYHNASGGVSAAASASASVKLTSAANSGGSSASSVSNYGANYGVSVRNYASGAPSAVNSGVIELNKYPLHPPHPSHSSHPPLSVTKTQVISQSVHPIRTELHSLPTEPVRLVVVSFDLLILLIFITK